MKILKKVVQKAFWIAKKTGQKFLLTNKTFASGAVVHANFWWGRGIYQQIQRGNDSIKIGSNATSLISRGHNVFGKSSKVFIDSIKKSFLQISKIFDLEAPKAKHLTNMLVKIIAGYLSVWLGYQ